MEKMVDSFVSFMKRNEECLLFMQVGGANHIPLLLQK